MTGVQLRSLSRRVSCGVLGLLAAASAASGAQCPDSSFAMTGSRRGTIDTTIVLAIADRGWQRDSVDAGVSLGARGTAGSANRPWRACAGASIHMGRATAQLHNVAGSIHFRADLGALDSIGRTRSSTPPAGPPRR